MRKPKKVEVKVNSVQTENVKKSNLENTGETLANFQSLGNSRLLRERLNKSVNFLLITGAATILDTNH